LSGRDAGTAPRGRARALSTPGGLLLAAALLIATLPVTGPVRDPDFWWHLRTGQLILDRHALLGTDPYTYTASSHTWVMHEWLTEVLLALLHSAGGIALIVVVLSAVTWAGLLLVVQRARLSRPHNATVALGLLLAVVAGYPIWGPRAQMITFALTCLVLLLVERHLRVGGRAIWALVPLFLVWSNLHSGFIIGAAFIVLIIAAEGVAGRLGVPGAAPRARVRELVWVAAACLAVVVINPNGPGIYLYPFQTQGSGAQQALILEWQSPDFHMSELLPFGFMLLSLGLMVATNRRLTPRDAVLALATVALALQSVRHVALFIAACTPLWIQQAEMTRTRLTAWRATRARRGRRWTAPPGRLMLLTSLPVLLLLSLLGATRLAAAATTREDSPYYAKMFPVCAARWLGAAPGGLRIFNQYGEGGYLASRLGPHGDRVFIFGDAALMGDALLLQAGSIESVTPGWEKTIRDAGTDLVLFDRGTALDNALIASPHWIRVYRDTLSDGFVPATVAGRDLAVRLPRQPAAPPSSPCSAGGPGGATAKAG
jgi:hypothetical protein